MLSAAEAHQRLGSQQSKHDLDGPGQCSSNGALASDYWMLRASDVLAHSLHLVLSPPLFPKRKPRTAMEICDDDIVNANAKEGFEAFLSCDEDVLIEIVAETLKCCKILQNMFARVRKEQRSTSFSSQQDQWGALWTWY